MCTGTDPQPKPGDYVCKGDDFNYPTSSYQAQTGAAYKTLTPGSKADNGSEYYQKILCLQQRITSDLNQRKINFDANGESLVLYISLRLVGSRYGDMRNGFSSSLNSSADLLSVGGSVGRPARRSDDSSGWQQISWSARSCIDSVFQSILLGLPAAVCLVV